MQCPKCQFENPEGIKFCGECGAKLERLCPNCNSSSPPNFKFCGECGHKLEIPVETLPKDLSFDEKLDKIQRYLPRGLTEKILAQRDRIEGERKQVTVMFCDMEGFTQLSEKLGPEDAYTIMDKVYEILIHKVHDYEGTVNEMTGDGIMALFGAPIALEDAPQRAIRSAYSVHREIARFSERLKQEKENISSLKMRIGINTGPVVVGTVGNDLRVEFKAVGDTVNLASRMEGLAEPGTTYVTAETFKLTEGFFRFESLGEKEIKGKAAPIKIYRVIAPSTRRTRFDVSAERGLTAFIGRKRELELLLDGFERAKQGRGQAFSIMAEAGIGKSRLLYEFRKAVANEDVTFLEGKCLSYSRGVAYHPIIDVLKSNFDIQEGDADSEITKKVKTGLKLIGVDEPSTLPYLLELLSVKDSGIDKIPMSPEARRDRIGKAVKRITLRGSEIRPLIIAIEDLHWIDKGSEEYLRDLINHISGSKLFLVFSYRPEFVHTWGSRSYHSQVNLNRLSNTESLSMVTHFLGTANIDRALEDLIIEKTEGVPFFIEEFTKSLIDLKIIERKDNKYYLTKDIDDVVIPSTINDMIMARVDSIPEGAKELLQTCSVIEREFSYQLINQVTDLSERELLSHLSLLKDSELLYERGIYPQSTYIFKHALTQETVYDSILSRRKKEIHSKVGQAVEQLYKDNLHEHCGILAEHFIRGKNYRKAAEYSRLAGKRAEKTASLNDAIDYTHKWIASVEKLPRTDDVKKEVIDARTALGLYTMQLTYFAKAKKAVEPIIDLASKIGYKKRLSQIYMLIGAYDLYVEENFPRAHKQFEKAIKISEAIKNFTSLYFASYWMGLALCHYCDFQNALYHLQKAYDINVAVNNLWGMSVVKADISFWIYAYQGEVELGYQISNEALRMAEESGDIYPKAHAYLGKGTCCLFKGFLEESEEHTMKSLDFCEIADFIHGMVWGHFNLAEIYFEIGEYQKSQDHYGKAIRISEPIKFHPSWMNLCKIGKARANTMMHNGNIDFETLYGYEAENKVRYLEGWMRRYIGETHLNIDNKHLIEAENWIEKALAANKKNGMRWHFAKDHVLYAELFKRKGDQLKAKETLGKAIQIFKECGADGWVKKYEKELSALS
jgi:class 3 adenylate cyclase/tetratricopeptide (TPR) repeat protein